MTYLHYRIRGAGRALLLAARLTLALAAASVWQLAASAAPLDCVDHGCTTNNQCVDRGCDACGSDAHCGLIP
jgi:hypothetical protein